MIRSLEQLRNQGNCRPSPGACWASCRILGREPGQGLPPLQNREVSAAPGWTWMPKVTGENKEEAANVQGRCAPTETVDTGWVITREIGEPGDTWRMEKSWTVMDPDPDGLPSGWKVGLCESLGAC